MLNYFSNSLRLRSWLTLWLYLRCTDEDLRELPVFVGVVAVAGQLPHVREELVPLQHQHAHLLDPQIVLKQTLFDTIFLIFIVITRLFLILLFLFRISKIFSFWRTAKDERKNLNRILHCVRLRYLGDKGIENNVKCLKGLSQGITMVSTSKARHPLSPLHRTARISWDRQVGNCSTDLFILKFLPHNATEIPFFYSFSRNCSASIPISSFMFLSAIYIFPL